MPLHKVYRSQMAYSDRDGWADPMAAFTTGVCDPQDIMLNNHQPPSTTPSAPGQLPPRFVLGQEVFILDSGGSELTGLNTYLVLSNHEKDARGSFLYRLMPSQEIVFRAAEKRLLEVTFPLGGQVKRASDTLCSVVTRRYVVEEKRVYDVRDELGTSVKGVKEEELSRNDQGSFSFVTKMERETNQ